MATYSRQSGGRLEPQSCLLVFFTSIIGLSGTLLSLFHKKYFSFWLNYQVNIPMTMNDFIYKSGK